ncbi:hypothetical protein LTR97_006876 [Elasticomyces elasticus]|uniref:Uncharacterized protein n=1 Tax=Elasticomyces elasticus TaxID=574655 RepID=A0AAN7W1B4_9PEZI|nr:hypothetical protein LTR97_006876 [Elasticomyces elasticus]
MGRSRNRTGHKLEGRLGLQTWKNSVGLKQLQGDIEVLKSRHRDTAGVDIRRSVQLKQDCTSLLSHFGSYIWPDYPSRHRADWLASAKEDSTGLYPIDLYWSHEEHAAIIHQHFQQLVVEKCIIFAANQRSKMSRSNGPGNGSSHTLRDSHANRGTGSHSATPSNSYSQRERSQESATFSRDGTSLGSLMKQPDNKRAREALGDERANDQKRHHMQPPSPQAAMPPPPAVMGAPRGPSTPGSPDTITVAHSSDPRLRQLSAVSTGSHVANRSARKELSVRVKYMLDDQKVGRQRCIRVTGYDNAAAFFTRLDGKVPFHARNEGRTVVLVAVEGIQEMEDMAFERELNEEEWELFQTCLEDMTSTGKPLDGSVKLVADLSSGVSKMEM